MAATLVLEPIFEADFRTSPYGFRPRRRAMQALETLRRRGVHGGNHVLDADIRDYFGTIDHTRLMGLVARRISDRRVLKLLRRWLTAQVIDGGRRTASTAGTPQGGVISPLLSNLYLHVLDWVWEDRCAHLGTLVRYADDFVVMCDTKSTVKEARRRVSLVLTWLGLTLHPEKTRMVDLSHGREGFDFLGCHLRKRVSGPVWARTRRRVYFLQRWPSTRAMRQVRTRVRELPPAGGATRTSVESLRTSTRYCVGGGPTSGRATQRSSLCRWIATSLTGSAASCARAIVAGAVMAARPRGNAPSSRRLDCTGSMGRFAIRGSRNAGT